MNINTKCQNPKQKNEACGNRWISQDGGANAIESKTQWPHKSIEDLLKSKTNGDKNYKCKWIWSCSGGTRL